MKEQKQSQAKTKRWGKSMMRRRSVTCNNACPKAKNDKLEQGRVKTELHVDENAKCSANEETAADVPQTSPVTTLKGNNRALAAALEDAQLDLRSVKLENVQLQKQIHEDRYSFVEKTKELEKQVRSLQQCSGNDVPKAAQVVLEDVYNLLSQTCMHLLQGTNFLSDALHLVRSLVTPSNGSVTCEGVNTHEYFNASFNEVSPHVDLVANAACTTPPPDELSAMEITASQDIKTASHREANIIDDPAPMDIDQLQVANRRSKRKSCIGVSYTEPNLNSKLRRGDRFTDTTLYGDKFFPDSRRRKRTQPRRAPLSDSKKKRAPLTNLTNIIKEDADFQWKFSQVHRKQEL